MSDIYDEVVPELNGLYRTFYDLQKMLFKLTNRHKKFDYMKLSQDAEKTFYRVREIHEYISSQKNVNPLLIDFVDNLDSSTSWMYLYLTDKALGDNPGAQRDAEIAFDELFKVSRRLTKSAKKIS